MDFDHAGIATDNAEALAEQYCELFETSVVHEEKLDDLRVRFLDIDGGYFELLEPTEQGTVQRYLDHNGPGIHHLALTTADIKSALERARDMGIDLIDTTPRPGAWGHEVAFLHPKSTGGVLIEFVQH
ncbi:methylmalonyl-CoA epimerase [Halocatena salina]|uniref:Methylmalonyl-CoA epimerase n=1 Tax=Halocatena salina TaxID=2934340 RepID=A0A8U0A496_9EURY|nr:methylmalonyl-CoA epimerase [Halocatena salina]UPM44030.1 methylmalonyl-CoA epimerase [Halocatena salina]